MVGTHPSSFMIAPPVQDACSAPTARRSSRRRPTPPRCNRSTVSTGRGASHSTTCIPGGITRGHRGDVLQTSRQWLRQDATEFRTQTNVHGAQDQRGLPLISALRSGSTGDPQTSFGSHKFACQRELAPRLNCRSIYPETDQRTGESATPYLGASVRPRVCGG